MNSSRDIYNFIYNDEKIRAIYDQIDYNEEYIFEAWGHHNFNHVVNVKNIVEELLNKLGYDENIIDEAKIAAILHDVGAVQGKPAHANRSYIFTKTYFDEHNIELTHKEAVLDAIKNHSEGFETNNIIQLALILADKLDIKYTRPTAKGLDVPGNRQYGNIMDIATDIKDKTLRVSFKTNDLFDKKELEDFYFTKKVGSAIKSFANKLGLDYKVYLNNIEWNEIF